MAEKRIKMKIPFDVVVKNKDVEFRVFDGKEKFGTLLVSKGLIEWLPAGEHAGNECRLSWERFAQVMKEETGG